MAAISRLRVSPVGLALSYGLFGAAYILFSDAVLTYLASDVEHYQILQTAKGWVFILMTSLGLWALSHRSVSRLSRIADAAVSAEDQLRIALTAAGGFVWRARVSSTVGDICWQVDGGLAKELGLPEGTFMGLAEVSCCIHTADRQEFFDWARALAEGNPLDRMRLFRFRTPQGADRWIKLVPNPTSARQIPGTPLGGVAFDLTQQQEVTQDLEEVIFGAELGTWRLDIRSGRLKINDRWADFLGYTAAELGPMTDERFFDLLHPDDKVQLQVSQAERWRQKTYLYSDEIRMRHKDGRWVWILTRSRPVEFSETGVPLVLSGVHLDISLRKALEEKLQTERDVLRGLADTSISGILTLDQDGIISFANKEAGDILGMDVSDMIGVALVDAFTSVSTLSGKLLTKEDYPYARVLLTRRVLRGECLTIALKDGRVKAISINAAPMVLPDGAVQVVTCVTDITVQVANEALLRDAAAAAQKSALHDAMTGLPNRALFEDYLGAAIADADQSNSDLLHVFLDLDNFKQVNDRFGHHLGDLLIQEVAKRLERIRGKDQVLARLAGDEFAILHPLGRREDPQAVLRRLAKVFERPFDLDGRLVFVTASMGVSRFPQDARTTQELWVNADLAMFEAKSRGRNQTVRYTIDLRERRTEESRIAQVLQRALKARDFAIILQPLLRLEDGQIIGAEALLRCTDLELAGFGPAQFLPVAERAGLMRDIDLMVVDLVGEAIVRLKSAGLRLRVSINLSPESLRHADFGRALLLHLERTGLTASDVLFELTEGALVDLSTHAQEALDLIHAEGFELSADDFGTGYSSLSYLHRLRLTEIKIDRSFIQRLEQKGEPSDEIVRAILALARSLAIRVIAEGIETEAQAWWLRRNGCAFGQGFHCGKGVAVETFAADFMASPLRKLSWMIEGNQIDTNA
ncbi:MAG: GGDEF domain-containing protein [Pseudorhodobacter sp. PARRP1]|nr:MAG: GGDEF domain-containing protein [Pseudorhodobacter sp. PARRP1]